MSEDTKKPSRQPYAPPKLVTYGDIAQLTQASATGKKADGGGKLKTKTV